MSPSRPSAVPIVTRRPLRTVLGVGALAVAALAGSVLPAGAAPSRPVTTQAGTRAQVPWSKVGSGWTLATWSPSTNPETTAKATLFLLDAKGHRYAITRVRAGDEPLAFSPAAQQALIGQDDDVAEIDLHTGRTHLISIPNLDTVIGYADPRGRSLLAIVDQQQGDHLVSRLERFDAAGRHLVTFPRTDAKAGLLGVFAAESAPDGTHVVAGAQHGLVVLNSRTGRVTRHLLAAQRDCDASSWWSSSVVLASCSGVLYTAPVSGAAAHRISRATAQNPFGYSDEWRTGPTTRRLGLAANGCGPESLVRFDRTGHGTRLTVPSPIHQVGKPVYVGHHRETVTMVWNASPGCQDATSTLFSFDAARGRSTARLGTTVNGGTVTGAVPFPTDR